MNQVSRRASAGFCALAAAAMVILRFLLFESCLFDGTCIPNHDMSQGLTFFSTSIQSLRLTGEIAWWNPLSNDGYAQYYQSFLSPLAPTPHHVTFLVWSYGVRLLSWLHVDAPSEYAQYLWFNYVLLPFLAYWVTGELARILFGHRAAVLLVLFAYALSSIGLWNGAWFYFQESFTLFFLLGSLVRSLQRPTFSNLALLGAALLVQISSLNYWTIYNTPFVLLFVATYVAFHPAQAKRLLVSVAGLRRYPRALAGVALLLTTFACWIGLTRSIAHEQQASYTRATPVLTPTERVEGKGIRTFTLELWNPGIEIAMETHPVLNKGNLEPAIHNARYVGVTFLPLLALFPFLLIRRRIRWLAVLSAELFVVCLAPSFLAEFVSHVPFLSQIQHLFYFYTSYWQFSLVLLGAGVLTEIFSGTDARTTARLRVVSDGVIAAGVLLATFAPKLGLPGIQEHYGYYIRGLLVGIASAVVTRVMVGAPVPRFRSAASVALLVLLLGDLGAYFAHGSRIDQAFTVEHLRVPVPIPEDYAKALFRGMPAPDTRAGPSAGVGRGLVIQSQFWPVNYYLVHALALRDRKLARDLELSRARPLDYFPQPDRPPSEPVILAHANDAAARPLDWRWLTWGYNDVAFEVTVSDPGWLFLRWTHDPLWRFTVDGQETKARIANFIGTGLRLTPGTHEVRASYRPLGRKLYGPASAMTVAAVGLLLLTGRGRGAAQRRGVSASKIRGRTTEPDRSDPAAGS